MVQIVVSMVRVGEFELCSDDVGIFRKALWWLEKCCNIGI